MTTIKTKHGCLQNINFHPEKPLKRKPKIIGEKIIDGVEFYLGEDGKEYVVEQFNSFWGILKGVIKNKFHKGDLIGHRGY